MDAGNRFLKKLFRKNKKCRGSWFGSGEPLPFWRGCGYLFRACDFPQHGESNDRNDLPLARTWSEFKIRIEDFRQSLRRADALDEENRNLRAENVRLQTEIRQVDYLRTENDRFREMLAFRDKQSYRLLACRVVERDSSNWWNSVLVDRGWNDDPNLAQDQPVVTPRGVIGKQEPWEEPRHA